MDGPKPQKIVLHGCPREVVTTLSLDFVGEEWDGSFVPISQLSYSRAEFFAGKNDPDQSHIVEEK